MADTKVFRLSFELKGEEIGIMNEGMTKLKNFLQRDTNWSYRNVKYEEVK